MKAQLKFGHLDTSELDLFAKFGFDWNPDFTSRKIRF